MPAPHPAELPPPVGRPRDIVAGIGAFALATAICGLTAALAWLLPAAISGTPVEELRISLVPPAALFASVGLASVIGFVGVPAWVSRRRGSGSLRRDFGLGFTPSDIGVGVTLAAGALVVAAALSALWRNVVGAGAPTNTQDLTASASPATLAAAAVVIAVVVPFAEEVFFRGMVLSVLRRRFAVPVAVAASSALFGLLHAAGATGASRIAVPVITGAYGAIFCLGVLRTGRLGASIVAHSIVNTVAIVALFTAG